MTFSSSTLLVVVLAIFSSASIARTDEPDGRSQKQLAKQTKPFPIVDNVRPDGRLDGSWWGSIMGVIKYRGKYRVYAQDRTNPEKYRTVYLESADLEHWSDPVKVALPPTTRLFQHDGEVLGYAPDGNTMHLYRDFDGKNFATHVGKAFDWRQDGATSMHYSEKDRFRNAGRIRGNDRPVDEGGWGGELPPFPADEQFQDRRGLSFHANPTFTPGWKTNRQLADPAIVFRDQLKGKYNGYYDRKNEWVPDFYAPNLMPDGKMFLKVFWKNKMRRIDRKERTPDIKKHRRFRLTGETYCVPAIYQNGKVKILSDESLIPKKFHKRKTHPSITYATRPNSVEVGQISMAPIRIEKNGFVYMFYQMRGDIHYEGPHRREIYPSGIYLYRLPKDQFEKLFESS